MDNEDIILEGDIGKFYINVKGEETGNTYAGNFKVKCFISPLDLIKADRKYRELLGINPLAASEHVNRLSFALSQLMYRVIEHPPFWENREILGGHVERNVLLVVLEKALQAEEDYAQKMKKKQKEIEETLTEKIKNGEIKKEDDDVETAVEENTQTTLGPND